MIWVDRQELHSPSGSAQRGSRHYPAPSQRVTVMTATGTASAAIACTPGPDWTRLVTPAGAAPVAVSPHAGHFFATTWYSITLGGGGGAASNTCRFFTAITGASARSALQDPHAAGPQVTVSSGSGDWRRVEDGAPGCLPGFRPDRVRSDRAFGFLYGLSEDGGFDDVDEALPSRRRSSSICSASTASLACTASSCASLAASCAAITSLSASSSATRARSHGTSSDGGTRCAPGTMQP